MEKQQVMSRAEILAIKETIVPGGSISREATVLFSRIIADPLNPHHRDSSYCLIGVHRSSNDQDTSSARHAIDAYLDRHPEIV